MAYNRLALSQYVAEMMNRLAEVGNPFVHSVWTLRPNRREGAEGFLIYRADHAGVTTPVVVYIDEPKLSLVCTCKGHTTCESTTPESPADFAAIEEKLKRVLLTL